MRRYTLNIAMEPFNQLQREYEDTTKRFMGLVDLEDRNRLKERRKAIRREVVELANSLDVPGPYWSTINM
jgi:hypothetical protein